MAKVDLKKPSGIDMYIENGFLVTPDLEVDDTLAVSVDTIRPQLLNQDLTCPDIFYTKYIGLDHEKIYQEKKIKLNVIVIPPNLAGIEYVKTKAALVEGFNRVIEVVYGGGLLVAQSYENSYEGDIIVSTLKKGQKVVIPAGYTACFVNTRQGMLVLNEVLPSKADEKFILDDMNGMAYYVIRKNAKQEVVRNPMYRMARKPRKVNFDKLISSLGMTLKTPIIKQILRKYERFDWLFKKSPIEI